MGRFCLSAKLAEVQKGFRNGIGSDDRHFSVPLRGDMIGTMKQDLWELLFRSDRLIHEIVRGDLSAATELVIVARALENLAGQPPATSTAGVLGGAPPTKPEQDA